MCWRLYWLDLEPELQIFEAACEAGGLSCSSGNMCTFTTFTHCLIMYGYCWCPPLSFPLPFPPLLRRALRTAECIVMLLGQVAVTVWEQHGVIATVVAIFQQRLFHPVCSLDGNIVIELGKMAAKTGVHSLYGQKVSLSHSLYTVRMQVLNFVLHTRMCAHYVHDLLLHTGSNVKQCMWLLLWCMLCCRIEAQWRFWVDRWHVL